MSIWTRRCRWSPVAALARDQQEEGVEKLVDGHQLAILLLLQELAEEFVLLRAGSLPRWLSMMTSSR